TSMPSKSPWPTFATGRFPEARLRKRRAGGKLTRCSSKWSSPRPRSPCHSSSATLTKRGRGGTGRPVDGRLSLTRSVKSPHDRYPREGKRDIREGKNRHH